MHRPFAIAALILALACSPQALAQTLPDPLDGLVTLDVNGGPITFPQNSTIAPGGATIQLAFGGVSSDFTVTSGPLFFEYLVVGGGGGGGTSTNFGTAGSGGGGGGGVVIGSTSLGSGETLQVIVGAGGAPGAAGNNMGINGADSSLGTIIALGGGGGAGGNNSGLAGGSGGGGRGDAATGGAGLQPTSASGGLGTSGGTGPGHAGGGGGGGAGATGGNAAGDDGGAGGAGFGSNISGDMESYGGGGGGGGRIVGTPGIGGSGGGGSGANNNVDATPGLPNTGGGGGGGNNDRLGAPGGSGIVIISYFGPQAATGGTITSSGGNTIHTFDQISGGVREAILTGTLSGSGSLTFDDPGTLVLAGSNSYTGGTIIQQGTVRLANGLALGASGSSVLINPDGILDINGVNTNASGLYDVTLAGGTITNTGSGQQNALRFVALTADSTFTGSGRWDIRGSGAGQFNAQLDLGGHTLTKTGGNKIAIVDATITAGTINVESGEFGLTRSNWSGGTVNVNGGSLWFENNSVGSYDVDVNLNGATLRSSGNPTTLSGPLTLTGTQAQNTIQVDNSTFTLAGGIAGSGGFTKQGGGTLILPTANTHSGTSNLVGGAVEIGHDQAFGTGLLDLRGSAIRSTSAADRTINNAISLSDNTTFGSAGTGNLTFTGNMNKGGLPKTINIQNEVTTFTGTITGGGTGEMVKTGPGRAVFDGNVTYPGATNVVEGTLEINGTVTNSPVTVLSDGRLSGSGSINTSLTVDGGTLAPGSADLFGLGTLTVNGPIDFASTWEVSFLGADASLLDHSGSFNSSLNDITLAAGDTFSPLTFVPYQIYQGDSQDPLQGLFQGFSPGGFGSLDDATGTGEINGTLFAAYINSTLDGQGNLVSGNGIVLFAIPEPGRAVLAVIGLFAMLLRRRR